MQWLQPSFTEGSIIVQDKQQSPTSPNDVEKWGILAEIFTKMMIFSKKKKKKVPNTRKYKAVPISQASGWAQHQGRKPCVWLRVSPGVGVKAPPVSSELLVTMQPPIGSKSSEMVTQHGHRHHE